MSDKTEELLRPDRISDAGFLGPNESLEEIIGKDTQTLKELGITHDEVARKLSYYVNSAFSAWKESGGMEYYQVRSEGALIDKKYRVSAIGWSSGISCPWEDGGGAKHDFTIENEEQDRIITFSQLLPHLISKHNFFEGKGTRYRLEPLEAVIVLEIPSSAYSKEEIEDKLYRELLSDLKSEYPAAFRHALSTLQWFKDRPELPEAILQVVSKVRENKDYFETNRIISLANNLPTQSRKNVNESLIDLIDTIDKTDTFNTVAINELKKFKREVEGTTHPILLHGLYWPDLIEERKEKYPPDIVDICVEYVESRDISFAEVCKRLEPYWHDGILAFAKKYGDEHRSDEEIIRSFRSVKQAAEEGLGDIREMTRDLSYLDENDSNPESVKKRAGFYEATSNLAALHILPERFADYLIKRSKALYILGKTEESKKFETIAENIYKILR